MHRHFGLTQNHPNWAERADYRWVCKTYTLTLYSIVLNTIKLQNFMDIKKPQLVKVEAFAIFFEK